MRYVDIKVNTEYGIRLKVAAGEPLLHVLAVDKVDRTKQVKVRHCEGDHEGMEEFVPFRHFIVEWKSRKALLRDEERLARVRELSAGVDFVTKDAVQGVFEATGDGGFFVHSDGHVTVDAASLKRVAARAGLSDTLRALDNDAFVDREGAIQMTFSGAERLAIAFAAAEPNTVLMEIAAQEEEYTSRGYGMGERHWHEFLRERRPIFALARQWAGFDSEVMRLNGEIQRLRGIYYEAVRLLEGAGLVREARRLRRAIDGQ